MSNQPTHFMTAFIIDPYGEKVGEATFGANLGDVRTLADVRILSRNVTEKAHASGDLRPDHRYDVTSWSEFVR